MIGYLRGVLRDVAPEQAIVDVGGVGYSVRIPLSTYYELERQGAGSETELLIQTQVREDAIELFGFATEEERGLFRRLIGVSGIGPRLAQVILSGMAPGDVVAALAAGDLARLIKIPGVGKKTAERMVLELRDAARQMRAAAGQEGDEPPPPEPDDELVEALVGLGYRSAEAAKAVRAVRAEMGDEAAFQELLRRSLARLSRV